MDTRCFKHNCSVIVQTGSMTRRMSLFYCVNQLFAPLALPHRCFFHFTTLPPSTSTSSSPISRRTKVAFIFHGVRFWLSSEAAPWRPKATSCKTRPKHRRADECFLCCYPLRPNTRKLMNTLLAGGVYGAETPVRG